MSFSFLTVLLVTFGGFLSLLALLSLAVTKTVNPDGQSTRGCFGGCAAALAVFFLCGVGLLGLGVFTVASAVGTAVDKNPIEKIEIRRGPQIEGEGDGHVAQHESRDWRHGPVHVLFTVRGNAGTALIEMMREMIEIEVDPDEFDLDELVTVHDREGSNGEAYQIVEFRLPIREADLAELEREIERELDGLRVHLPESVAIHFEGAERFY